MSDIINTKIHIYESYENGYITEDEKYELLSILESSGNKKDSLISRLQKKLKKTDDDPDVYNSDVYDSDVYEPKVYKADVYKSKEYDSDKYKTKSHQSDTYKPEIYNSNVYKSKVYDSNVYKPKVYKSDKYTSNK